MSLNSRVLKQIAIVIGINFFLLYVWQTSIFRISKNFYEVDPGKFYRSAQLSPSELEQVIKNYRIKTVVSLRGAASDSFWLPGEEKVLNENNVKFEKLWWTIDFFPQNEEIKKYAEILKNAERPILIHCRTGADRTGEATALYKVEFMKESIDEAINSSLNFNYWHVQAFHPAKSDFIREWKGIDWAINQYDLCSQYKQFSEPGNCR